MPDAKRHDSWKWDMITEQIAIVDKMDFQLANSKIGMIEVRISQYSLKDSQKIFNIVFREGRKIDCSRNFVCKSVEYICIIRLRRL